jgi:hypothetical protein
LGIEILYGRLNREKNISPENRFSCLFVPTFRHGGFRKEVSGLGANPPPFGRFTKYSYLSSILVKTGDRGLSFEMWHKKGKAKLTPPFPLNAGRFPNLPLG